MMTSASSTSPARARWQRPAEQYSSRVIALASYLLAGITVNPLKQR